MGNNHLPHGNATSTDTHEQRSIVLQKNRLSKPVDFFFMIVLPFMSYWQITALAVTTNA